MPAKKHIGLHVWRGVAVLMAACAACLAMPAWAGDTAAIVVSVVCDPAPPQGTLAIDGGAAWTTSLDVTLSPDASDPISGVSLMRFSNDGITWSDWEPYAATKSWLLAGGADGLRTVYAQYADEAGNANGDLAISASIAYDIEPPLGGILINGGAPYANSRDVTLTLDASDAGSGVDRMRFSNDGVTWSPETWDAAAAYAESAPWTLEAGDGAKTVYVQYRDYAGRVSEDAISDDIVLDTTPAAASFVLADRTPSTLDRVVFAVTFTEDVLPDLSAVDISLVPGSLAGDIEVTGSGADYTIAVTMSDADADGTVAVAIAGAGLADAAGNPFAGAVSAAYTIHNWHGLSVEPAGVKLYAGQSHTFAVDGDFGPIVPVFQWKWADQAKAVHDGPAAPSWRIEHVGQDHRGAYWCEIVYDGVLRESARAVMEVEDPLLIVTPPADASSFVGNAHTFHTQAAGGYLPLSYLWKKDGAAIAGATEPSYTRHSLETSDSGIYTVEIADANTAACSASAELSITWGMAALGLPGLVVLIVAMLLAAATAWRRRRA
ncbi:MAG TPA: immunoglobulin domain-containing protein [Candidatus Hydrogenedentes bacterium]|nr:immunoglobulin domain-containing protein [Candidatus Hydrogenedentota bacterium]HRT19889.1 immunoglobulin domain-containing protein [Candidatus Hydrogenedentota bacterium]HRT65469.1 immunoglobulin domain-containing protein [Candidatus Hydrogenedentota bacterium]